MQSKKLLDITSQDNYDVRSIVQIINEGEFVDQTNYYGFTPLYNVSYDNRQDEAEILIKYGANINKKTNALTTPIFNCVGSPSFSPDFFIFLCENGADTTLIDKDGETIFDWAKRNPVAKKYLDIIESCSKQIVDSNELRDLFKLKPKNTYTEIEIINNNFAVDKVRIDYFISRSSPIGIHQYNQRNRFDYKYYHSLIDQGHYLEAYKEISNMFNHDGMISHKMAYEWKFIMEAISNDEAVNYFIKLYDKLKQF